jgi:hypothetical protein
VPVQPPGAPGTEVGGGRGNESRHDDGGIWEVDAINGDDQTVGPVGRMGVAEGDAYRDMLGERTGKAPGLFESGDEVFEVEARKGRGLAGDVPHSDCREIDEVADDDSIGPGQRDPGRAVCGGESHQASPPTIGLPSAS